MNGQDYIYAMDKQKLLDLLVEYLCVRDFGFETEYSAGEEGQKWCCDHYQGDCKKCWSSNVVEKIKGKVV